MSTGPLIPDWLGVVASVVLVGIAVLPFAPETKGRELPE